MIVRRIVSSAVQVVLSGGTIWQALAGVAVCAAICAVVAVVRARRGNRSN